LGGPFEVRPADPDSAPAVAVLFREAYRRYYDRAFLDDDRLARYLAAPGNSSWVALAHGRVVGFAALTVEDGRRARLSHLVRHPEWGRGAGSALEEARQAALAEQAEGGTIALAYAHCLCSSPASEALKLRHGFRPVAIKLGHLPDVSGSGQRDSYVVVVKHWPSAGGAGEAWAAGPGDAAGAGLLLHERVDEPSGRADVSIGEGRGEPAGLPPDAVLDRLLALRGRLESLVCSIEVGRGRGGLALAERLERERFFAIGSFPCPPDRAEGWAGRVDRLLQHLAPAVALDRAKIGLAADSSRRLFEAIWARYRDRAVPP
jgi:hypothetical protein